MTWSARARIDGGTVVPRVGILSDESPSVGAESFEPFAQGLRGLGWIEGRNIVFEHRSAERKNEILPSLAAELVRLEPNVSSRPNSSWSSISRLPRRSV